MPKNTKNQNRIDGLNKALSEVRANCSDSQLRRSSEENRKAER